MGAMAHIAKGISAHSLFGFPPLAGRFGVRRLQTLARAMRGFDLILTYNWGAMDAVMAHALFGPTMGGAAGPPRRRVQCRRGGEAEAHAQLVSPRGAGPRERAGGAVAPAGRRGAAGVAPTRRQGAPHSQRDRHRRL
jgi:hypothetical protein